MVKYKVKLRLNEFALASSLKQQRSYKKLGYESEKLEDEMRFECKCEMLDVNGLGCREFSEREM